jgi:hypothetical protein
MSFVSFSQKLSYKVIKDEPDKIKKFTVHLDPFFVDAWSTNSTLGFEMLEGLATGDNYTWSLTYQRTLSNNMQINLNYDGRKTPLSKIIHTGGIQVRAFF